MDEPTASLDPMAEVRFYRNYKKLLEGSTCLFITHRLGSTYLFDKCLVLHKGKIYEEGTHEELMMKEKGLYKELYNEQREWFIEKDEVNYEGA